MITIKEMATMLGISTTTVSNVIHGKTSEVSKATVEKVQNLIKEYHYVPNISARNLASKRSGIIGVAMLNKKRGHSNYLQDAFMAELVGSIEREVSKRGLFLMMYFSETVEELITHVYSWNVDGMIMFGIQREDYQKLIKNIEKPLVFIDSYLETDQFCGVNIGLDDRRGGFMMGEFLYNMGHQKIAFVADNNQGCDHERFLGFVSAMNENGISVKKDDYFLLDSNHLESSLQKICEQAKDYTAIFCASDYYALMTMNALIDYGYRVPEDISISGFDDNIYSRMVRPKITTVHQSPTQKGEKAVEAIVGQLSGDYNDSNWIVLPVKLCVRDSVKNLKK